MLLLNFFKGSQDNHIRIRKEIQDFLRREMELYEAGSVEHGWWDTYYSPDELDQRIKIMSEPAANALDGRRWCSNFDLIAAAILYDVNVVMCKFVRREREGGDYYWEIHRPERRLESVNTSLDYKMK